MTSRLSAPAVDLKGITVCCSDWGFRVRIGESRYIGLLDGIFGVGVVARNAAGNSIKAAIMGLHNCAECAGVTSERALIRLTGDHLATAICKSRRRREFLSLTA